MSLLTRLVDPGDNEEKLGVHAFMAALAELQRGAPGINQAAIAVSFNLSASEQVDLAKFITNLVTAMTIDRAQIHDVLILGETGHYTVAQVKSRLGI